MHRAASGQIADCQGAITGRVAARRIMGSMHVVPHLARVLLAVALGLSVSGMEAPARTRPIVVGQGPLAGVVIALDPGHNGGNAAHAAQIRKPVWIGNAYKPCNKVGTSTTSGYPEHAFTFDVALRVKASLEKLGAAVFLTRPNDTGYGPCVDVRGKFGERVHADLTVSIHGDGAGASNHGFFVMKPGLVVGYTDDIRTESGVLATAMRDGLTDAGLTVANYYAKNGLITRTDLGTLNWSDVPIVMIELGNMKNATDAARMKSRQGRTQYSNGIVLGIRRFLGR
jgi:N-acetylmuramoyl-L-alanine amidase